MSKRTVSGITLTLLLVGMLALAFNIQPVEASGTIYIRADGSIDPPTANITTVDNITYTFTGNTNESIVVEKDNIVVDGAGYTVQGTWGGTGIDLSGRSNVTIKNTEIKRFENGIRLDGSSNNTVSGNNITNNGYGILLDDSSDNTVSGNNITANSRVGIQLGAIWLYGSSDNNTVSGNSITANSVGIDLYDSSDNSISGNNITANNDGGIWLERSSNNTFRNNDASDNEYNFAAYGPLLSHYIQNMDHSNTVDGKPVYYWVNRQDMTVPVDAGYVALVNCTRITVKNLNLTNNGQGILLASTTNSTITKNNITNNQYGIWLRWSSNNTVSGNNITNNNGGIYLSGSSDNTVSGNNITNNDSGIWLSGSSYNIIFHNNFLNNTQYVSDGATNVWDNGYPSGGNYWSDYVGVDADGDGIGDTTYVIDPWNIDHYPLANPYAPLQGDLNDDRRVDIRDIGIVALAFGSSPDQPRWNEQADMNHDSKIDIKDVATVAMHFGEGYS